MDHGGLFVWNAADEQGRSIVLDEDAQFLRLAPGANDFFAVTHFRRGSYFVTARHIHRPAEVLARIDVNGATARAAGEAQVWAHLPQFFGGWDNGNQFGNFRGYSVIRVDRASQNCEVRSWSG